MYHSHHSNPLLLMVVVLGMFAMIPISWYGLFGEHDLPWYVRLGHALILLLIAVILWPT